MMIFFVIMLFIFLIFGVYLIIEHQLIITRKDDVSLKNLPENFDGLKILQISDIHHRCFGKDQSRIIKRAKELAPDIIVITGDLISRDMRDFSSAAKFCGELSAISPVLFSLGNHELDLPEKVRDTYISALKNAGVSVLINSSYQLSKNGQVIDFTGISLDVSVYHAPDFSYNDLVHYSLQDMNDSIGVRSRCTVLLAHNPFMFETYSQWNADLILSGHVHGGIVRLPVLGGLLSPERKFFPKYSKGLYFKDSSVLYVSAGLGKFRIFDSPEINLITLNVCK